MAPIVKLKVFVDADVLIAGSVSTQGASHIILLLSDLTLVECLTSEQAKREAERNLIAKLPKAVTTFQTILRAAVTVVKDPDLTEQFPFQGQADPKDLPILVAAIQNHCHYLVAFNVRHYSPTDTTITVLRPGELLVKIRQQLTALTP